MIIIDDLGYADISYTGQMADVHTANIDYLAEHGTLFTHAYATSPICNASRLALMTGAYQQRQGQYWYSGPGMHDTSFVTIAEIVKNKGYTSTYIGKVHYGLNDHPDGRGFPLNHGFDSFYGFTSSTKHYLKHKKINQTGKDMLFQGPMWIGNRQQDVDGFSTELFGEQACNYISAEKDDPFFLTVAFNAVHNYTYQLPSDFLKKNGLKGYPDYDPSKEEYWEWRKKLSYPSHPQGREYYLGQLFYLDKEIGRIIQSLKENQILDNTAIILVSDNGGSLVTYANNTPLKGGKYTLFEGGIRVPLIISWPEKFRKRVISDNIVSIMDILPTVCEISGSKVPKNIDGIGLSSLLTGIDTTKQHEVLYWDTGLEMAIRQENLKLLITKEIPNWRLQIVETPIGEFLFDLEKDPGEERDVRDDPETKQKLRSLLFGWKKSMMMDSL